MTLTDDITGAAGTYTFTIQVVANSPPIFPFNISATINVTVGSTTNIPLPSYSDPDED